MKNLIRLAALLAAAATARAEGLAVGVRAGTLGPGLEAVAWLTPNLNLRATANYVDFNVHGTVDTTDYDADVHMSSFQGLLDLHPVNGNFRLTAGLVYNQNDADLEAIPTDPTVDIGGVEYPSAAIGTILGKATFDEWAPYIGIGYGNAVFEDVGLTFSLDIGVMYQGEPHISLDVTGPAKQIPGFEESLAQEEADVQDEASHYTFYPVIAVGICWQFW